MINYLNSFFNFQRRKAGKRQKKKTLNNLLSGKDFVFQLVLIDRERDVNKPRY